MVAGYELMQEVITEALSPARTIDGPNPPTPTWQTFPHLPNMVASYHIAVHSEQKHENHA